MYAVRQYPWCMEIIDRSLSTTNQRQNAFKPNKLCTYPFVWISPKIDADDLSSHFCCFHRESLRQAKVDHRQNIWIVDLSGQHAQWNAAQCVEGICAICCCWWKSRGWSADGFWHCQVWPKPAQRERLKAFECQNPSYMRIASTKNPSSLPLFLSKWNAFAPFPALMSKWTLFSAIGLRCFRRATKWWTTFSG